MIGADTNLIVRFLVRDDAEQVAKVRQLFGAADARQESVFISDIVLCEVAWVLEKVYGLEKSAIIVAVESLLADATFGFFDRPQVEEALAAFRRLPGQFADHLIRVVARHAGCSTTWTFDKPLAKSPDFDLLR